MPFHNSKRDQCELYIETLDVLQGLLDIQSGNIPIMLCNKINPSWYKDNCFNDYSVLLFDFICNNNLIVSNFSFDQPVNYTYFKGQHRTYIDHVFNT